MDWPLFSFFVCFCFFLLAMKASNKRSWDLSLRFYTQYCRTCRSVNWYRCQQHVNHPITDQELRSDCPSQSHLKLCFTWNPLSIKRSPHLRIRKMKICIFLTDSNLKKKKLSSCDILAKGCSVTRVFPWVTVACSTLCVGGRVCIFVYLLGF